MELKALHWNGLRATLVIENQYISSRNVSKNCLGIIHGVPQGSILRPLLFLIYVIDLFKATNPLIEVMFADDIDFFLFHKNIDTIFASINVEVENIWTWFKSNKFSVNVDKTKRLLFHPLSKE